MHLLFSSHCGFTCFASDKNASTILDKQIMHRCRFVSEVDFIRNTRNVALCYILLVSTEKLNKHEMQLEVKVLFGKKNPKSLILCPFQWVTWCLKIVSSLL